MPPDSAIHDDPAIQLRQACAELHRRVRAGVAVRTEEFLAAFPSLAANADFAVELIYTEFTAREERGERLPPEEWYARFPQWRDHLRRLLQVHTLLDDVVGGPVSTSGWTSSDRASSHEGRDGARRLGHYELLEEVGRGGMGVVYKARDVNLDRVVALKLILSGAHAGTEDVARFRAEAEAAARLQHPHIIPIYEVGESDDGPYLTMEFVAGGSLAQQLTGNPRPPRQAAALVETLARAIHDAHAHGIVHRDLKPANVLLTDQGVPKITDFGLAKRLHAEPGPILSGGQTRSGSILGTPSYMAPEQAGGEAQRVGPRTDVYALGAILYELLTGRPPFGSEMSLSTLARVVAEEPVPPTRLRPTVPRDLETICLKCLHKEPHRRYAGADALADDLRRFLAGEPIRARPVGSGERCLKWARRRPAVAALIGVSAIALVSLLAGSLWYNARLQTALQTSTELQAETQRQAQSLREQLEHSRRSVYALQLAQVETVWQRDPVRGLELLNDSAQCPPDLRDFTWGYFNHLCKRDRLVLPGHAAAALYVAYAPDGKTLAVAVGTDRPPAVPGEAKLWDVATGQRRATLKGHPGPVWGLTFSPDGRKLATVSGNRWQKAPGEVKLWDATTFVETAAFPGHAATITAVAFSPDGTTLATASADKTAKLWDAATGQELATFKGHADTVTGLAFSPDGKTLATASADRTARLWDIATAQVRAILRGHTLAALTVAFSPDGKTVATGGADQLVILWDAATGQQRAALRGHANRVRCIAFAPDGKTLLTGSDDYTVRLWDVPTGHETTTLRGHERGVLSVAFSPDGQTFATGSQDQTVKVWAVRSRPQGKELLGHKAKVMSLAFAPDGTMLASGSVDQTVRLWDLAGGQAHATFRGHTGAVRSVAFAPDGATLATASEDKTAKLWDLATGSERRTFQGHEHYVDCVAFTPDGRTLVTGGLDQTIRVWEVATGQPKATLRGHSDGVKWLAFAPDGTLLASVSRDGTVKLWKTATWEETATLQGHTQQVNALAFAPDGRTLATGSADRTVRLWDLERLVERCTLRGHTHNVSSVAFSPDGRTLATGAGDRWINAPVEVKLWDATTGQVRATLQGEAGPVAFSPDGKTLATGGAEGSVRLWYATLTSDD